MAFTDFFDCYVQPSRTLKLRRVESLPTVNMAANYQQQLNGGGSNNGCLEFRAIGCNPLTFKNILDVVKNNQVWIPMRLHELIYLQL